MKDTGSMTNLCMTHSFVEDFLLLDPFASNFAFARVGPHELAVYFGSRSAKNAVRTLRRAIDSDVPGYHLGIPCSCCSPELHNKLKASSKIPESRMTYSNEMADGNYERFKIKYFPVLHYLTVVAPSDDADIQVPENIELGWDYRDVLKKMRESEKPIFVAAGPLSLTLVYEYWTKANDPQTVIDVGAAMDPLLLRRNTKEYHDDNYPASQRVCEWEPQPHQDPDPFTYI